MVLVNLYEYHSRHKQWPGTEKGIHAILAFFIEHAMKKLHPEAIVRGLATGIQYNAVTKYCTCGYADNADLSFNAVSHIPNLQGACAHKALGCINIFISGLELVELAYMALMQWAHKNRSFLLDYLYSMCSVTRDTEQCTYFRVLYAITARDNPWSSILCARALQCERDDLQYFASRVSTHIKDLLLSPKVTILPADKDVPWLLNKLLDEPFLFVSRQWLWVLTQRFITYAHIEVAAVIHDGRKSADLHLDNTIFLMISRRDKALLLCYYIWLASTITLNSGEAPPNILGLFAIFSQSTKRIPIASFIHSIGCCGY